MCSDVPDIIGTQRELVMKFSLNAHINLVDCGILESVVDDIDAAGTSSWKYEAGKWIGQGRRSWWKHSVDWIEKELRWDEKEVPSPDLYRQRSTVQTTLKSLDL
jgi:hypothetical protein